MNRDRLSHFASQVRKRFDAARRPSKPSNEDGHKQQDSSYLQRYWGGVLKTILAAQRNLEVYVALCQETDLAPVDCVIIAGMLQARRKPEQALEWVERGLDLEQRQTSSRRSEL